VKKYSVHVSFKNSTDMQFETDTNVKSAEPLYINGGEFIVTENEYMINIKQVKEVRVVQLN
jgi:hypothetical protein